MPRNSSFFESNPSGGISLAAPVIKCPDIRPKLKTSRKSELGEIFPFIPHLYVKNLPGGLRGLTAG
jgi:hypothetical protein